MVGFEYNYTYDLPAPFVRATFVTAREGQRVGPLPAFVDIGADGTLVPLHYLAQVHTPPTAARNLRSHWGERRRVLLYLVDVHIGALVVRGMEAVGDDQSDEVILGAMYSTNCGYCSMG